MSQTSPRRGVAILFLKGPEQGGGGGGDFLVSQRSGIEREGATQYLLREGTPLFHREMLEDVQQCFGISAHELIIPVRPSATKRSFCRLEDGAYSQRFQGVPLLNDSVKRTFVRVRAHVKREDDIIFPLQTIPAGFTPLK